MTQINISKYNWVILERRRMAIFPVAMLMRAYTCKLQALTGINHRHFIMSYRKGYLTAIRDREDWNHVGMATFNHVLQDPGIIQRAEKTFRIKAAELLKIATAMSRETDNDIASSKLFDAYCDLYTETVAYGECIPYTIKEALADALEGAISDAGERASSIGLFSQPHEMTFTAREERDLLRRILEIQEHPDSRDRVIREHLDAYGWMSYDYDGEPWSLEDCGRRFAARADMSPLEIAQALTNIDRREESIRLARKVFKENPPVDQRTLDLLQLYRDSIGIMDLKKELLSIVHYRTLPFFAKLAEGLGIDRRYLSYLLPYELGTVLRSGNTEALRNRFEASSVYISPDTYTLLGAEDRNYLDTLWRNEEHSSTVRGLCACPGKVVGVVRVVHSVEDLIAFQAGEILLATMTTIDYLEAIKKAAAIVTDDGGIICHAAVVSRELGIPAVVGTKRATSVFKTGDHVLVNSSLGVVERA